ncbi:MAG: murein biosynthesis integral membrane protein MurJ [Candidatus Ratteibacteria bacterium]|nr:murein biosynthesis integral membrane protein MurJ [Candidatus Ratteibacteria bacterium]
MKTTSANKSVTKSAGIIAFATLISRILGLIRIAVIARLFGVYVYAQAFVIAFKIPNLFRDFLGEGAANSAIVPVFSEYTVKHSKEEFWELANVVLNLILVSLTLITLLGIAFSPVIVRIVAPGFIADPYKLQTTITLTRLLFPYILLVGLAAYAMAILNSLKHFSIPAFAPCLFNVSVIIFALMFGEGTKGLSLGVLIGGIFQIFVQVPILYKKGFRLKFPSNFNHPAARTIGKLMIPRVFSSAVYQLNNIVDSIFGSLAFIVGEGGVAGLDYAYRLILFPLGIFSTALSQAILPTFSRQVLEKNHDNLKHTLSFGLRATFFVMLPSSVGFMVLAGPIISTLFGSDKFDTYAVNITASVLFFYSIGLFAYGAKRILQSCFFALKDTITPTKIAVWALVINIVLNAILIFPLKLRGIALATSISGIITFFILFFLLKKKIRSFDMRPINSSFLRILSASIGMGVVCYFSKSLPALMQSNKAWLNLILLISAGIISYIVFCFIFQVKEMQQLYEWIKVRKASKQSD